MAELLVRVVDKVGATPESDAHCTKAGDVIAVKPDGWSWGNEERANPDWVILQLPGVPVESLRTMLEEERSQEGVLLRKRIRRLDLSTSVMQEVLSAGERVVKLRPIAKRQDVLASVRIKAPFKAPIVLGN